MNGRLVLNYMGQILRIEGVFMLPALVIAIALGETGSVVGFVVSAGICLAVGTVLTLMKTKDRSFFAREGFVTVALSWIMMSLVGALPFCISGAIANPIDAFFESVSGFTTTGATILSDVESLPKSDLYWRSFTHWLGGMGVLVFFLAIAPISRGGGTLVHLLRAESTGPTVGKLVPKLRYTARILYGIYIVMTLSELVLLLVGGMPLFDSVTTALGTAGTGGFSVRNASIAAYDSVYLQMVVAVFMVLFSVSFNIYHFILLRQFRAVYKNEELRLFLGIVIVSTVVVSLNTISLFESFGVALRYSFFQVSSIISTTGFATSEVNTYPELSRSLLILLMIFGGCAGSTGGGIKISRLLILLKFVKNQIHQAIHPRSVKLMMIDGHPVEDGMAKNVCGYMVVYVIVAVVSVLLISLDGFGFETTFTSVLSALNNIGPSMGLVGSFGNYGSFSVVSKLVLIVNMIIGRLEIFPMILLFVPSVWRRSK
ncbi:MAG: TrkH family potassium uptake protein [Clostridia bacterium]|nr:TrkH family potassium uptake protein [Clostridia bacterium]